jgi:CelD/BcsL family acetyltransferase involved in cellulose biosynthesis
MIKRQWNVNRRERESMTNYHELGEASLPLAATMGAGAVPARARAQAPPLLTEVLRGGAEIIERLADEWRGLCEEGPCQEPFYRPEWIAAYVRAFAPDKELLIITARLEGRLRAVLPLIAERARFHGVPVRKLRSAANIHSCRFDLVRGAGDDRAAAWAVWQQLKATPGWDVIEIRDVPPNGAMERVLRAAQREGHPVGKWASLHTRYIPLPPPGVPLEQGVPRLDKDFRYKLRKWRRKLERKGPVAFRHTAQADPAALERFYALENSGWKGQAGTSITCDAATRQFYDEVARAAARFGYLTLYELECDGRVVAMHYGLRLGGRYFVPKMAYDEAHKNCGLGHLILHEVLQDCAGRGESEFDFLGDDGAWKRAWTRDVRPHAWCYVFRRGLIGQALYALKFKLLRTARQIKRKLSGQGEK